MPDKQLAVENSPVFYVGFSAILGKCTVAKRPRVCSSGAALPGLEMARENTALLRFRFVWEGLGGMPGGF